MLEHTHLKGEDPKRLVIIGARGFIGKALRDQALAKGVDVLGIGRADIDLTAPDAASRLCDLLRPDDSVVAASAVAPCKSLDMLKTNLTIVATLVRALADAKVSHVINISSDAVFADGPLPLREDSPRAPTSYHGIMHLAREVAFATELACPLAILRPTLVYGAGDPHNGYGPNQFRRKANRGEPIVLFGEGEERRDHVAVEDVAALALRVAFHRSRGSLNVATGTVTSFRDVANLAVRLSGKDIEIRGSVRKGPMPHNGYRPFDSAATSAAFPDFQYTALADGMSRAQKAEFVHG